MKKFLITSIALLIVSTNQAFAISAYFEGLEASIGLATTGVSSIYQYSDTSDPLFNEEYHLGDINYTGVINLSYLKTVDDKWLIGGGTSYDLSSFRAAKTNTNTNSVLSDSRSNASHHFSVYVQPTYALNRQTALFTKIGYHLVRVNLIGQNEESSSGSLDYLNSMDGIGYSLGLMTFLDKDVFIKTEIEYVDYKKVSTAYNDAGRLYYKLTTISGIFSIGYRF